MSILIAITLGRRESLIVFLAIPVTLALTLAVFYLYGYTLNRITLFALIFSIGIGGCRYCDRGEYRSATGACRRTALARHTRWPSKRWTRWGNPTILAALTVVAAILPMAFVAG